MLENRIFGRNRSRVGDKKKKSLARLQQRSRKKMNVTEHTVERRTYMHSHMTTQRKNIEMDGIYIDEMMMAQTMTERKR